MTAANIRRHSTRFLFLQNPNDLLIAEPAAFHSSVPLKNRLYRKLATIKGGTSARLVLNWMATWRRCFVLVVPRVCL
jgi:hypothetical protein